MSKRHAGFTLIELMIALVVVGILATIAYPAYLDSVRKSKRADAKAALLDLKLAQEKMRANCPFYANVLVDAGAAGPTCGATANLTDLGYANANSSQGHYTIAITANSASGTAFTATATAQGDQANDTDCNVFTLTVAAGAETLTPTECLE